MTTPTFSDTLPLAFCGFFSSNSQTESLASSFTSGQPLHGCTSQDLVLSPLLSPTLIFLERSHTTPCSKEHQYGTATQVLSRPDRSSRLQATHSDICTQIPTGYLPLNLFLPRASLSHLSHLLARIKKETTLTNFISFTPDIQSINRSPGCPPPKYKPTQTTTLLQHSPH